MAQLAEPFFSINGNPIMQFSSFSLYQNLFDRHRFTLVCPAQSIDGKMGIGNPPAGDFPTAAFGDVGPLIINYLPYSSLNSYKKGVPSNAPSTGEPPAQYRNFLSK